MTTKETCSFVPHNVRRKDRLIDEEECFKILNEGEYGVLATVDVQNQPYAIPLSYIYLDKNIYFHCAHTGHKIENIKSNSKICFTVVGKTKPVYDKNFTTYYESTVVFGTINEVSNTDLKYQVLFDLAKKYLPAHIDKADKDIANSINQTAVYSIDILSITGKAKKAK